jgi:hypothetical protein
MRRYLFWLGLLTLLIGMGVTSFVFSRDQGWLLLPGSSKDLSNLYSSFKQSEKPQSFLDLSELYRGPEQKQVLEAFLQRKTLPSVLIRKQCETIPPNTLASESPRCEFKIRPNQETGEKGVSTRSTFSKVSEFSEDELRWLVQGAPAVLTKNYLLVRDESQWGFSPLAYWVYDRAVAEKKMAGEKYQLSSANGDTACLYEVGNLCWTFASNFVLGYLYRYSFFILFLVFSFLVSLVAFFWKRFHEKNEEQQRYRLALQVLSHEFRTPVSAMLLLLEQLSSANGPRLHEPDALTRLEAEAFRLQRVVEVSKTYLQAEGRRLHSNPVFIESLNDWCSDLIASLRIVVDIRPLQQDLSVRMDPFWLGFVISNLLQNAAAHGAQPIVFALGQRRDTWTLSVCDAGNCEFSTFAEMAVPFKRSSRSRGMGLGLNIIRYVLEELGGSIDYQQKPTTFTIAFKIDGNL